MLLYFFSQFSIIISEIFSGKYSFNFIKSLFANKSLTFVDETVSQDGSKKSFLYTSKKEILLNSSI
jgi:hypothetical protein